MAIHAHTEAVRWRADRINPDGITDPTNNKKLVRIHSVREGLATLLAACPVQ